MQPSAREIVEAFTTTSFSFATGRSEPKRHNALRNALVALLEAGAELREEALPCQECEHEDCEDAREWDAALDAVRKAMGDDAKCETCKGAGRRPILNPPTGQFFFTVCRTCHGTGRKPKNSDTA